ncbi:hypothetical protein M9194_01625 [Vibrio sp. S4M6]|uniref:hypothetical protein n=1 Tax=Vibrio sinus TaxID=2946865 RepID=UPI00202A8F54|nr:hypothetical protein [Vibrio sinus]MCL9780128.1 hypothetical protein [Vibrio sinus]
MTNNTINPNSFSFNDLYSLKSTIPVGHEIRGRNSRTTNGNIVLYSKSGVKDSSITIKNKTSKWPFSTSFSARQNSYDKGRTEFKAALLHLCGQSDAKKKQVEQLFQSIVSREPRSDGHSGIVTGNDVQSAYNIFNQSTKPLSSHKVSDTLEVSSPEVSEVHEAKEVNLVKTLKTAPRLKSHILPKHELLRQSKQCEVAKQSILKNTKLQSDDICIVNPNMETGVCHNYALHNEFHSKEVKLSSSLVPSKSSLHRDYLKLLEKDPNAVVAVFYQGGQIGHTARYDKGLDAFVHTLPEEALFTCPPEIFKKRGGYTKLEILTPDMKPKLEKEIRELDFQEQKQQQSVKLKDNQVVALLQKRLEDAGLYDVGQLLEDEVEYASPNDQKLAALYKDIEARQIKSGDEGMVQYLAEQIVARDIDFDVDDYFKSNSVWL